MWRCSKSLLIARGQVVLGMLGIFHQLADSYKLVENSKHLTIDIVIQSSQWSDNAIIILQNDSVQLFQIPG